MQNNDLRAELIRQFPAEVVEISDGKSESFYACPICSRPVSIGTDKCVCNQVLSWKNVQMAETARGGMRKAILEFEVAPDFTIGNCRKCPISYIGKEGTDNIYECPLKMRGSCTLKLS